MDSESDCKLYFEARNDEISRQYSRNTKPLFYDDHKKWYFKAIGDTDRFLFVIECDGNPVGYCRVEGSEHEISIALLPQYRGRGIGYEVVKMVSDCFKSNRITLHAVINSGNKASLRLFSKAGYVFVCEKKGWQIWKYL